MKVKFLAFITTASLAFLNQDATGLTTMKYLSLGQLTEESSMIIIGKVESAECQWNSDYTMITTLVKVALSDVLKGAPTESVITIKLIGGSIGNIETVLIGSPTFRIGEETLLFLRAVNEEPFNGFLTVTGLAQGKFEIQNGTGTAAKVVTRDISGIHLMGNRPNDFVNGRLSLDVFVKLIREQLERETKK